MTKKTYGTMYYVDDMVKSVDFYKKMLRLEPSFSDKSWSEFSLSGHNLCLHLKDPAQKHDPNGVMIFSVDGTKNLYSAMKNDGYNVFGLHEVHPQAWTFHLKDKDNNELSFYGQP